MSVYDFKVAARDGSEVSLEESSATELTRAAAWLKRQVPNE